MMLQTFSALLLAHVLADYVFQTNRMVVNKRQPMVLGVHVLIVALSAALLTGAHPGRPDALLAIGFLAGLHLVTDLVKLRFGDEIGPYLADQAVHLLTLLVIAAMVPALWAEGFWPAILPDPLGQWAPVAMAIAGGFIFAVRAGGFAMGKLLRPYQSVWGTDKVLEAQPAGLEGASQRIGELERGLAFLLILAGHPTGVAFLIAAKSLLRFNASSSDRRIAEYVIIGTLSSVGWAMITGFLTLELVNALQP